MTLSSQPTQQTTTKCTDASPRSDILLTQYRKIWLHMDIRIFSCQIQRNKQLKLVANYTGCIVATFRYILCFDKEVPLPVLSILVNFICVFSGH